MAKWQFDSSYSGKIFRVCGRGEGKLKRWKRGVGVGGGLCRFLFSKGYVREDMDASYEMLL